MVGGKARELSSDEWDLVVYLVAKEKERVQLTITNEPDDMSVNIFRKRYIGNLDKLLERLAGPVETLTAT
ncbi:MAG: hypothetical protein ABI361_00100 [Nitrososphaera sp.]